MMKLGVYIHIPFCVKKCNYCDFLSFSADEATQKRYVNALCQEIRSYQDSTRRYELATVYFGGGTPSVLKVSLMEQLLESIQKSFTLNLQTAEITMEVNEREEKTS